MKLKQGSRGGGADTGDTGIGKMAVVVTGDEIDGGVDGVVLLFDCETFGVGR